MISVSIAKVIIFPIRCHANFAVFPKNTHFFIIFRKNDPVFRDMIRFFTLFSQKQPCFFGNIPEKSFYRIFRKQHP